ncbi:hypothetical protein MM326_17630 [Alkalihalobacillus sp. LMS6]|uniref:hypothetical protein n=1 Tax=Alkalihalobacillus sp. LMS6 TaxID=2924034 RepID=UPI0020D1A624|nr:hypothetical protein [Alkalihalobacillus sp. LMS6]UTR05878.1 hypothetical protein MM326_17630 [Alkalihalobacillus sp. LMS6]
MIQAVPSLPITDLSLSLLFYEEQFGFKVIRRTETFLVLQKGQVYLRLYKMHIHAPMYCGFFVSNIHEHMPKDCSLKQLKSIGKLAINQLGELSFTLKDPDGNTLEMIETPVNSHDS